MMTPIVAHFIQSTRLDVSTLDFNPRLSQGLMHTMAGTTHLLSLPAYQLGWRGKGERQDIALGHSRRSIFVENKVSREVETGKSWRSIS